MSVSADSSVFAQWNDPCTEEEEEEQRGRDREGEGGDREVGSSADCYLF